MANSIPIEELNKETMEKLGISLPPSFGEVGSNLRSLGKVFNAIKDLNDDEALRVLQQVQMYIISRKNAPDIESVQLPGDGMPESYAPPIEWTLQVVAKIYKLKPIELKQRGRDAYIVEARQVAMYVLAMTNKYSFTYIGQAIGGRSPATATHAFARIGNRVTTDPDLKNKV
ncbi:unnamed protein product, partial [marine sediment metagenome]